MTKPVRAVRFLLRVDRQIIDHAVFVKDVLTQWIFRPDNFVALRKVLEADHARSPANNVPIVSHVDGQIRRRFIVVFYYFNTFAGIVATTVLTQFDVRESLTILLVFERFTVASIHNDEIGRAHV